MMRTFRVKLIWIGVLNSKHVTRHKAKIDKISNLMESIPGTAWPTTAIGSPKGHTHNMWATYVYDFQLNRLYAADSLQVTSSLIWILYGKHPISRKPTTNRSGRLLSRMALRRSWTVMPIFITIHQFLLGLWWERADRHYYNFIRFHAYICGP